MGEHELRAALLSHRLALQGFIFALTRDHEVSDEVFQEVALAILDEAARGADVRNFLPWAREIARRRVARYYSQRKARARTEPLPGPMIEAIAVAYESADEPPGADGTRLKLLRECLDGLSARAREAVDRRYRDGMGIREVASAMAWKIASVNVALSRAKKALAECVTRRLRRAGAS